jgi:hypothetical protein
LVTRIARATVAPIPMGDMLDNGAENGMFTGKDGCEQIPVLLHPGYLSSHTSSIRQPL